MPPFLSIFCIIYFKLEYISRFGIIGEKKIKNIIWNLKDIMVKYRLSGSNTFLLYFIFLKYILYFHRVSNNR